MKPGARVVYLGSARDVPRVRISHGRTGVVLRAALGEDRWLVRLDDHANEPGAETVVIPGRLLGALEGA